MMNNQELMIFFKEMNDELDEIIESNFNYQYEEFDDWKNRIIPKLYGSYLIKIKRIDSIDNGIYPTLKTILRDMYFKYNIKKRKVRKILSEKNF